MEKTKYIGIVSYWSGGQEEFEVEAWDAFQAITKLSTVYDEKYVPIYGWSDPYHSMSIKEIHVKPVTK